MRGRPWLATLSVGLLAFVALELAAWQRVPWRTDEHRYIEVARELGPGTSLLVPHLNGQVYTHKPPGFFWATAAIHELGLPLPRAGQTISVLAAAATLALTFALGRRLFDTRTAVASTVVLISSGAFLGLALRANLDALLTLCTTAAIYAYVRSREAPEHPSWLYAVGALAGLGVLVKGPVALLVPAVVVVLDSWRSQQPVAIRRWAVVGLLALAPSALWALAAGIEGGFPYVWELAFDHGVRHADGSWGHRQPFWFYAAQFPVSFLPWSLVLPAAAVAARRARAGPTRLVFIWLLAPLALLSLFPAKRPLYLLPLAPAMALFVGSWLGSATRARETRPERWLSVFSRVAPAIAALGTGAAFGVTFLWATWSTDCSAQLPASLLGAACDASTSLRATGLLACAALLGVGARLLSTDLPKATLHLFGVAAFLFLAFVAHPLESQGRDTADYYRDVGSIVGDDLLLRLAGADYAANWRLRRSAIPEVNAEDVVDPASWSAARDGRSVWLLAETEHWCRSRWAGLGEPTLRFAPALGKELMLVNLTPRQDVGVLPASDLLAVRATAADRGGLRRTRIPRFVRGPRQRPCM